MSQLYDSPIFVMKETVHAQRMHVNIRTTVATELLAVLPGPVDVGFMTGGLGVFLAVAQNITACPCS